MFLSADKIKAAVESGLIDISPYSDEQLKPASYTFTLSSTIRDPLTEETIDISPAGYALEPGAFVIGRTVETIDLKHSYLCILGNRSTLAQKGIDVLQSSTIAEPDTNGPFTLEITNNGHATITLFSGMPIAKGIFTTIS